MNNKSNVRTCLNVAATFFASMVVALAQAGWKQFTNERFSFSYPANWAIDVHAVNDVDATAPGRGGRINVSEESRWSAADCGASHSAVMSEMLGEGFTAANPPLERDRRSGHTLTSALRDHRNPALFFVTTVCSGSRRLVLVTKGIIASDHSWIVDSIQIQTGAGVNKATPAPRSFPSLEKATGMADKLSPQWNDMGRDISATPTGVDDLIGRWRFDQGQGITGLIDFRRDGTYHYVVSQGSWKVEHEGKYSIQPHARPRTRVLLFRPSKTLSEANFYGSKQLGERMMLDNSPNSFYLVDDRQGRPTKTLYNQQRCGFCAHYWVISR
jgi:hypothetical protein